MTALIWRTWTIIGLNGIKAMTKKEFILANNGTFSGMFYQKGGNWRCRKVINGEMVEMVIKTSYLHKVLGNKPMYNHVSE